MNEMEMMVTQRLREADRKTRKWMGEYGIVLLRASLGIIFLWFGLLKFFPALSPAEILAQQTIEVMSFGKVTASVGIRILAVWECVIGVGLLLGKGLRLVILLLLLQMVGAMSPLFLFPDKVFIHFPWVPSLEGQYIIKNLVLISAAIVIGATVDRPTRIAPAEEKAANFQQ